MTYGGSRQLSRSPNGMLGGVCEGLATRFGMPANIVRFAWLVAACFFGTGVMLYLVLWWILPRADLLPAEPTIWLKAANGRRHPPLARTVADRRFLGVCGGIARRYDWDSAYVRLALLSALTFSAGIAIFVYFAAAILMPGPQAAQRSVAVT